MSISIKDLNKVYPNGNHALKDINLEIPTGMFGLLGPNGAGDAYPGCINGTIVRTGEYLRIRSVQTAEGDQGNIRLSPAGFPFLRQI